MRRNGFALSLVLAFTIIGVGEQIPVGSVGNGLAEAVELTSGSKARSVKEVDGVRVEKRGQAEFCVVAPSAPADQTPEDEITLDLVSYPAE